MPLESFLQGARLKGVWLDDAENFVDVAKASHLLDLLLNGVGIALVRLHSVEGEHLRRLNWLVSPVLLLLLHEVLDGYLLSADFNVIG